MTAVTTTAAAPPADTVFGRISGALQRRDFRWWFVGQVTSTSGTLTQGVAMSWTLLRETGDAMWLSVLVVCLWGPTLVLGPWAGALVDRADRRRLLIGTQVLLLVIAAALAVLEAAGGLTLWAILGLSVLSGVVATVDSPARQVFVVDLVGKEAVASAIGLWEVALNASRVVGPGLGGALLAASGAAACFGVNALTYCVPLVVLLRMRPAAKHLEKKKERGTAREGFRYAFASPVIRALLPMSAASGLIFGMNLALPTLASRALHLGGGGFGALMAAFGIGGLPGALIAAAQPVPTGRRVRVLAVATAFSVVLVAFSPDLPVALGAMVLTGLTSIWFVAAANTLLQLRCAPDLRGRVLSLWGMAMTGTTPITGFGVTAIVEHVGAREGFAVSGIALAAAVAAGWRGLRD